MFVVTSFLFVCFQTLNILSHSLLTCKVFAENSEWSDWWLYGGFLVCEEICFQNSRCCCYFCFNSLILLYIGDLCLCVCVCVWGRGLGGSLTWLDNCELQVPWCTYLSQVWEVFSHFLNLFGPVSFFLHLLALSCAVYLYQWCTINILGFLHFFLFSVSLSVACSFFFFFFPNWIFSNNLSLTSQFFSSAQSSPLLMLSYFFIPTIVFFSSIIFVCIFISICSLNL